MGLTSRETKGAQPPCAGSKRQQSTPSDRAEIHLYLSVLSVLVGLLVVGAIYHWCTRPVPSFSSEHTERSTSQPGQRSLSPVERHLQLQSASLGKIATPTPVSSS